MSTRASGESGNDYEGPSDRASELPPLPGDRPLIGVGHSLGFPWLLRQPVRWSGLVSINGFPRFTRSDDFPGVPPRLLDRMIKKLETDPQGVAHDFLRRCGVEDPDVDSLSPSALAEGLDWLAGWDLRESLASYRGPLLAVAAADDPIVPEAMSRASFPAVSLDLEERGGHLLPLTAPRRCAESILRLLNELEESS